MSLALLDKWAKEKPKEQRMLLLEKYVDFDTRLVSYHCMLTWLTNPKKQYARSNVKGTGDTMTAAIENSLAEFAVYYGAKVEADATGNVNE